MNRYTNVLEAKVAARNCVNAAAMKLAPGMLAELAPFMGKKLLNQGSHPSEKAAAKMPKDNQCQGLQWWYRASGDWLYCNLKATAHYPSRSGDYDCATYAETRICLAKVDGNVLVALEPLPVFRVDYSTEEVREAREALKKAQAIKREAESNSAIQFFGEYDQG